MDLPSRLDLYALGREYIQQKAKRIDPDQVDVEGSDINIIVGSTSIVADAIVKQLAYSISKLLLDGCEKEDLDRYAWDRYNMTRKGAANARGTVRIYRDNITAGLGSVPIGTKLLTLSGIEYVTTTTASFGATDTFAYAKVRAVQAGKSFQVGKNNIRKVDPNALGSLWDKTLKVNNDDPMAGGEEVESDDDFKLRIRNFWRTARRGILAAIETGALEVPGVTSAQAIEVLSGDDSKPARLVMLYIADSSGVASDVLASEVDENLLEYRCGGINVIIVTSMPQIIAITLKLTFRANVDTETLTENIRAALVEYINSLPVNGTLYVRELGTVLSRYKEDGLIADQATISAPTGDLVPDVGKTLRTTMENVRLAA